MVSGLTKPLVKPDTTVYLQTLQRKPEGYWLLPV